MVFRSTSPSHADVHPDFNEYFFQRMLKLGTSSYYFCAVIGVCIAYGTHEHRPHPTLIRTVCMRVGLLLLAAVYCLAVRHVASVAPYAEFQGEQHASHAHTVSDPAGLFLFHTSSSEGQAKTFNKLPAAGFKTPPSGAAGNNRAQDLSTRVAFSSVDRVTRDILLALRRSALIFPFHYFW